MPRAKARRVWRRARVPPAGRGPGWRPSASWTRCGRPPAIRWGLSGSYDGEFTGLGPRWTAPFTEVVHAGLGTPGGAAPAPARRSRARAVSGSRGAGGPRAPRDVRRLPMPARSSSCACPTRSRAPTWWAGSAGSRATRSRPCSLRPSTRASEVLLAGAAAASGLARAAAAARIVSRTRRHAAGRGGPRGPRRAGGDRGLRRRLARRDRRPAGGGAPRQRAVPRGAARALAGTRCASATVRGRPARAPLRPAWGSWRRSCSACALRRRGRD